MPSRKKVKTVNKLKSLLSEHPIVIATDYRGLSVNEINDLRGKLLEQGAEYHVVKNTLTRIAVENTDKEGLIEFLKGPTAVACLCGDASETARILVKYVQLSKDVLEIKGGVMDGQVISSHDISVIATLPSREVLIAMVVGSIKAPIQSLANVLGANLTGLVTVLHARAQQLGEGEG